MTRLLALGDALATTIAATDQQRPAAGPPELRGRVIDAITGAPVADASVVLLPSLAVAKASGLTTVDIKRPIRRPARRL